MCYYTKHVKKGGIIMTIKTTNFTFNDITDAYKILGLPKITTDEGIIKNAYQNMIQENQKDLNNINKAYQIIKEWLKIRKNNNTYNHCLSILNYLSRECQISDLSVTIPDILKNDYQKAYNEIKNLSIVISSINNPTLSKVNTLKDELKQIITTFQDNLLNTYHRHNQHVIIEELKTKLQGTEDIYNLNHVYEIIFNLLNEAENTRINHILNSKNNDINAFYEQFTTKKDYLLIQNIIEQRKAKFKENLANQRFQKIDLLELFIKEKIIINRLFDQYTLQKRNNQTILQDIQTLISYQIAKTQSDINYKNYLYPLISIKKMIAYLSHHISNIDFDTFEWIINSSLQISLSNKQSIKNLNTSLNIICYTIKEKYQTKRKII